MALYRAFVKLTGENIQFVAGLQRAWVRQNPKKRRPSVSDIIRSVLEDYEEILKRQVESEDPHPSS